MIEDEEHLQGVTISNVPAGDRTHTPKTSAPAAQPKSQPSSQQKSGTTEEPKQTEPPLTSDTNVTFHIKKNGEPSRTIKIKKDEKLEILRKRLADVMNADDQFVNKDQFPINTSEEKDFTVDNIANESVLLVKSKEGRFKSAIKRHTPEVAEQKAMATKIETLIGKLKSEHNFTPDKLTELTKDIDRDLSKLIGDAPDFDDLPDDPLDLKIEDWGYLLAKNNLLNGLDISGSSPRRSINKVVKLKITIPRFMNWDVPEVTASSTYSQRTYNYIRSNISKQDVSVGYAFARVGVEHSNTERAVNLADKKTLFMAGEWSFPRALLQIRPSDVQPQPDFVNAIKNALRHVENAEDPESEKYKALQTVFNEYGHVFPTEIVLGGKLSITTASQNVAIENQKKTEDTLCLAVAAKLETGYGPVDTSGGATNSTAKSEIKSRVDELQNKKFTATGGNTLLTQSPSNWIKSLCHHQTWSVINLSKFVPLYQLLDDETSKQEIRSLVNKFEIAPSRVFDMNNGDKIGVQFYVNDQELAKGDIGAYKSADTRAQLSRIKPRKLTLLAKKFFHTSFLTAGSGKSDFELTQPGTFEIEFPIEGNTECIAIKWQGRYISIKDKVEFRRLFVESSQLGWADVFDPGKALEKVAKSYEGLARAMIGEFNNFPKFPLVLEMNRDNSCIFKITVIDKEKKTFTLSPYQQTYSQTGNTIPKYVAVCEGPEWAPHILAAKEASATDFCVFQIVDKGSADE